MKKLIAISVVFALVVGTAFAVDIGAAVTGSVDLFKGSSAGGGVTASGEMNALQLKGSGEVMDGKFGATIRLDPAAWKQITPDWDPAYDPDEPDASLYMLDHGVNGYAWWKPIDQFKLIVGLSHADDGFWGKEGVTGWMFNQKAYDGIATGADNIWSGWHYSSMKYRNAFADDLVAEGIFMEIKPMDMLGINIGIPVFGGGKWDKGLFEKVFFQVDLNFSFGNIAITYKDDNVFLYFGGSFGAIALDVGLSVPNLIKTPTESFEHLYFGAGLKFSAGAFGVKFRTAEGIPVKTGAGFNVLFDVLPYFSINDNMTVFVNAGMGMDINNGLARLGWGFNPYIRIGAEWGPSFYAGVKIEQKNMKASGTTVGDKAINFAVPIGISVGF
jgi:hypothetical protein